MYKIWRRKTRWTTSRNLYLKQIITVKAGNGNQSKYRVNCRRILQTITCLINKKFRSTMIPLIIPKLYPSNFTVALVKSKTSQDKVLFPNGMDQEIRTEVKVTRFMKTTLEKLLQNNRTHPIQQTVQFKIKTFLKSAQIHRVVKL